MLHPIPYLSFDGTCAEAVHFYERALDGKFELRMRNADSPFAASTRIASYTPASCCPVAGFSTPAIIPRK